MSLRVGLMGFGLAGRLLHAPVIVAAGCEIAAVASSRADAVRADFPNAALCASPEELCARRDVDLVVIVTPDRLHAAHTRLALEAGKHVVVDKPFAMTAQEGVALIDLAKRQGRVLSVFHNRRWDSDFLTVQKALSEGLIGEPLFHHMRWDRMRPNPRGDWHDDDAYSAGELYGLGPHLIDQALVLYGLPDWLQADVCAQRDTPAGSDFFEILMGKGKLRISLGVSSRAADEARFYRILGSHGALVKHGLDPQEGVLRRREGVGLAFGVEPEGQQAVLYDGKSETQLPTMRGDWRAFYRQINAAIATGAPNPVSPQDAVRVIAILEAAQESARRGVRIDLAEWVAELALA